MGSVTASNTVPLEHQPARLLSMCCKCAILKLHSGHLFRDLNRGRGLTTLNLAIAEMYLQGVSTRKVAKVMQEICGGNGVSSSYVSQCTSQLDELFEKWRTRQLPPIAHLFLDATYTKVRLNGVIVDCAVFVAVGIDAETGRRMVLGVSVECSEAAAHWTTFIQSLLMRGMNRPLTVTSDDHTGIRAALARPLTGVLWQRCQFHLQQNAQSYVTNSRHCRPTEVRNYTSEPHNYWTNGL